MGTDMKKTKKANTFQDYLKTKLRNKTFKEAYEPYGHALEIGIQVRDLRKKAGLTQIELAKKLGVSQQVLSRLESGEADNPTVSTLERIAQATGHRMRLEFEPSGT